MAKGDWGSSARLVGLHIEIDLHDDDGHVTHAGVGYHVEVASGRRHPGGFTIHSPDGGYVQAGPELEGLLARVGTMMAEKAREHEGLK